MFDFVSNLGREVSARWWRVTRVLGFEGKILSIKPKPWEGLNHEKNPQAVENQMDDDSRRSIPNSLSDEGDDPGGK